MPTKDPTLRPSDARPSRARPRLDAIDRKILAELSDDGRITNQKLSERVGLTPRPCLERVRRLEKQGVITGYRACLDPAALGHAVIASASISMREPLEAQRRKLERVLLNHDNVVEVLVVSGDAEFLARFVAPSLAAYERMTATLLNDRELGIRGISTTFVLREVKAFSAYPVAEER